MSENTGMAPHRWSCGDIEVHTLPDGVMHASFSVLQGIDTTESGRLMEVAGRAPLPDIAVNTFLVHAGGKLVLVDTGVGPSRGPELGLLPQMLRAVGVTPAEITTVLLTHLHGDHIGGLATEGGSKLFPHAELVVSKLETAYWLDRGMAARVPEDKRGAFDTAVAALKPYHGAIRTFTGEVELLPGITAVPLAGHTHGHTGFLLQSGGERALIWGDIVHFPDIQSARPEVTVGFDVDPVTAIDTRRRVLAQAADTGMRVAGMHMHAPGIGRVERRGDAYAIMPQARDETGDETGTR